MSLFELALLFAGGLAASLMLIAALAGGSPTKQSQRRLQAIRLRHSENTSVRVESQLRRTIAAGRPAMPSLALSAARLEALALKLERSGTGWTAKGYLAACLGLAACGALILYIQSGSLLVSLGIGTAIGMLLPKLLLARLIARRRNGFVARFPDAIELLVRGLRSGLPVTETLGVVAREVPGPVGIEFRSAVERMKIGRTLDEALQITADKLALPEFQFFVIALAIQRETGGNLAETLSNLADVLRKRSQMKLKIRALSSESKASAYIVGSLPFIVFALIWWINPGYLDTFFVDQRLIIAGLGGFLWMSLGIFIMARMVSFEI